jgi:hypothetical protein
VREDSIPGKAVSLFEHLPRTLAPETRSSTRDILRMLARFPKFIEYGSFQASPTLTGQSLSQAVRLGVWNESKPLLKQPKWRELL